MKLILTLGAALTFLTACRSEATQGTASGADTSKAHTASLEDRSAIVAACVSFETNKACNCVADVLENELGKDAFKKVVESARNGASTPNGWKRDLLSSERETFDAAMDSWNETCELS